MASTTQKRIVIFLTSLGGGGAEKAMLHLAMSLHSKGHQVSFFLIVKEGPYLKQVPQKIEVVSFNPLVKRFRVPQSLLPFSLYLRRESPDVIISAMNKCNLIAIVARAISGIKTKLIISEQNFISLSIRGLIRKRVMHLLIRLLYPRANFITAASKGIADDLSKCAKIPQERVQVVYNPIIDEKVYEKCREDVSHPFFSESSEGVVIGVGSLSESKGFANLIEAFSILRREKNLRLIILGEGEEREKLEEMTGNLGVEKYVSMPGFVDNPYAYMARSKVFVHPAIYEGLGNVLVEAMACGTPVVATNCPTGPAEALDNGRFGRLVPVKNINALAEAIKEAMSSPRNHEELCKRAKFFSVEAAANKYLKMIR